MIKLAFGAIFFRKVLTKLLSSESEKSLNIQTNQENRIQFNGLIISLWKISDVCDIIRRIIFI